MLAQVLPAVTGMVDVLERLALERDLAAEDWSTSIQILCKACSEGKPHSGHEHPKDEPGRHRRVAIAAPDAAQAQLLLEDWRSQAGDIVVREFDLALDAAV